MHVSILSVSVFLTLTNAALNGRCTGANGASGVCVSTTSCDHIGGVSIVGACPNDPDNVRCCTKSACSSGGNCRWTSDCASGKTVSDLCPGPNEFKCCMPGETTGGQGGGGGGVDGEKNVGEKILAKAKEAEGVDYVWASGSCKGKTNGGFDCSGLLSWAVCQVTGRDLFNEGLRVTSQMYCASEAKRKYKKVLYEDRRAGDAIFWGGGCDCSNGPENSGVHHVGIMMNDKTLMWNALKTGTKVGSDDFGNWKEKYCPYVIRFD